MFKKKLAALLVIALATSGVLVGCGSESSGSGESEPQKQEEQKKDDLTVEGEIEDSLEYDLLKFNGTIKNNTDKDLEYVEINIVLYDKDNAQIGTALDNTNNLKAGGTWKFEAITLDNVTEFDHYEYELSGF